MTQTDVAIRPSTLKPVRIHGTESKVNAVQSRQRSLMTRQERGYDQTWMDLRALFLMEYPLCRHCDEQDGLAVPAIDVDHIIDIVVRPDLRLDWDNLQSLCKTHHGRKTNAEQRARRHRALSVGSIKSNV